MESNFNNKDFEQFLKRNADQYRMFPSEKVWKGIHNSLHTRRWIYSLGFGLLLLSAGVMTWMMMNSSGSNRNLQGKPVESALQNNKYASSENKNQNTLAINSLVPGINKNAFFISSPASEQKDVLITVPETPVINQEDATTAPVAVKPTNPIVQTIPTSNDEQKVNQYSFNLSGLSIDNNIFDGNKDRFKSGHLMENRDQDPLSIESVMNSYQKNTRRSKISLQLNFVPTISYRKLKENKAFINSSQSVTAPFNYITLKDVNSVVTHKPAMGLEFGLTASYPLSKNFRVTAGLQFNVNSYDIKAYSHSTETATIAVSTDVGAGFNYVTPATNYRNFDGYQQNWLKNLYFSVSAPIGAEMLFGGNNRAYLGVGASVQPTYIIGDQAYLISTDYKNYAEVPSLMRKFNVNTSIETFAGYSTGRIKWKVGPQVRYQVLSSFQEKYPVKEHLFDFGLKVGIMLNK